MQQTGHQQAAAPGRRRFLQDLARWGVALGLGGGLAALVARNPQQCLSDGRCHGCPQWDGCRLPAALAARDGRDRSQR